MSFYYFSWFYIDLYAHTGHDMAMSTITNPRHLSLTAPLTIAITDVERPIRFSPAVQAIINRCGPQPAIGGRYAAWVHGLLPPAWGHGRLSSRSPGDSGFMPSGRADSS